MQSERDRWEALFAEADEMQMVEPDMAGDWSMKDLIAHVTAYERGLVKWLDAASRGELLELPDLDHPDVDRRNATIYSRNRDRPLREVLVESRQVFRKLMGLVQALPEDWLTDPEQTEWLVASRWGERRALWKCVADDSYTHYRQHIPDIRTWLDRAKVSH